MQGRGDRVVVVPGSVRGLGWTATGVNLVTVLGMTSLLVGREPDASKPITAA